jgi:phenylpropionate dioxygenase-like ring-hydroxylating dioxygenase large terminal subunit
MGYLKNCWYAAAWSEEITAQTLLARTFLDQPFVLFRDADSRPVALHDRCPHRFAPLSRGRIIGHTIQCPYHGLRFDTNGKCALNPHGAIPMVAKVLSRPIIERYGMAWMWMGDPASADVHALPDFGEIDNPKYTTVRGTITVNANYELVTDNLLDLSHVQFLHPLLGNPDSSERTRFSTRVEGNTVWSINDMPNEPVTKLFRMLWNSSSAVGDRRAHMRWNPPSNLLLDVGYTECGRPPAEGAALWSAHWLTPATERTTHYFWAATRNTFLEDTSLSDKIQKGISSAFMDEDAPMISSCQERMGTVDLMSLQPLLLKTDAAAIHARRVLLKAIDNESRESSADTSTAGVGAVLPRR